MSACLLFLFSLLSFHLHISPCSFLTPAPTTSPPLLTPRNLLVSVATLVSFDGFAAEAPLLRSGVEEVPWEPFPPLAILIVCWRKEPNPFYSHYSADSLRGAKVKALAQQRQGLCRSLQPRERCHPSLCRAPCGFLPNPHARDCFLNLGLRLLIRGW